MKKILSVFFLSFMLSGCAIPFGTIKESNAPVQQQVTLDQQTLDNIKNQVMQELRAEIQNEYQGNLTDLEKMIINVGKVEGNSVLGVSNFKDVDGMMQEVASGSGVIYKENGGYYYLVTNNHVIEGADKISIVLPDGTYIDGTLVGTDKLSDLAVVKFVSSKTFVPVQFGDSDQLQPGQFAIAIGNPLGYDYYASITFGNISGLSRNVPVDYNEDGVAEWTATLIQHDAAINPGNSGGGLFDITGKLIGINNMKIVETDVNGIGFAIPSNTVKDIIAQLEANGQIIRPSLGITGKAVSEMLKTPDADKIPSGVTTGVYVESITPNSSADGTELRAGDIIIKYNDADIKTFDDLRAQINNSKVGDHVTLQVNRQNTIVNIEMTLKVRPN